MSVKSTTNDDILAYLPVVLGWHAGHILHQILIPLVRDNSCDTAPDEIVPKNTP